VYCIVLQEEEYENFKKRVGQDISIGMICTPGSVPGQLSASQLE
jgi:hypothetical protein